MDVHNEGNVSAERPIRVGALVLCGGKSTRMGRPKLSLPFGGETMLARVVRILAEVLSPVVVVAAPGQAIPPLPIGTRMVVDEVENRGPLGGLVTGLRAVRGEVDAVYASSCDVPLLQVGFVRALVAALGSHELVMPRDGKYYHPLAAVYRTGLLARIERLIAEDRLRPFFLVEQSDARLIDVSDLRLVDPQLSSLRNANTPEEYAAVLRDAGFGAGRSDLP